MRRLYVLLSIALLVLSGCGPGTASPTEPPTAEETATLLPPTPEPTVVSPLPTESPLPTPASPEGTGGILLVIAPDGFRDEEYAEPRAVFEEAGYPVVVASLSLDVATGMLGMEVQPDILLAEARAVDYEAVVFIGGSGAQVYWDDPQAHRVAREAAARGKVVAAICIAPVTLARAGVLEGKAATVFDPGNLCGELEAGGALCTGAPVQRDGLVVTANSPQVAVEFAETILQALREP